MENVNNLMANSILTEVELIEKYISPLSEDNDTLKYALSMLSEIKKSANIILINNNK